MDFLHWKIIFLHKECNWETELRVRELRTLNPGLDVFIKPSSALREVWRRGDRESLRIKSDEGLCRNTVFQTQQIDAYMNSQRPWQHAQRCTGKSQTGSQCWEVVVDMELPSIIRSYLKLIPAWKEKKILAFSQWYLTGILIIHQGTPNDPDS